MFYDIIIAVVYGLVQGLTEFLPISSSGHLIILHRFWPLVLDNELAFDVVLHFGTLVAVGWYFRREIISILKAWIRTFFGRTSEEGKIGWFLIAATIPAVLAGWWLGNEISAAREAWIVAAALIVVGLLIIIVEKLHQPKIGFEKLSLGRSLIIGLAQVLAFIPGVSRSASTILTGMAMGLDRPAAIKFSFLLSLPVIFGASAREISVIGQSGFDAIFYWLLAVGFMSALISGFFTIKYFLRYAARSSLIPFAYYRILLGALIIIFLIW